MKKIAAIPGGWQYNCHPNVDFFNGLLGQRKLLRGIRPDTAISLRVFQAFPDSNAAPSTYDNNGSSGISNSALSEISCSSLSSSIFYHLL